MEKEFAEVKTLYTSTNTAVKELERSFKEKLSPYFVWFDSFLTDNGYKKAESESCTWASYSKTVNGHKVKIEFYSDTVFAYLNLGTAELLLDGDYMRQPNESCRLFWHEAVNCAEYYLQNADRIRSVGLWESYKEIYEHAES